MELKDGQGALPQPEYLRAAEAKMRQAIHVASQTPQEDIPVGAIVYAPDGQILATATNRREADADPTAHAEVLAIRQAAHAHGDGWRLEHCTLVVTLEPCSMCAGALLGARIGTLIFGAYEPKTGACGSVADTIRDPQWTLPTPQIIGGVLEKDCAKLLDTFFRRLRG